MCLQIRSLDFEIEPAGRRDFKLSLKRLCNNFLDDSFDGSLNVSQKYIIDDFGQQLAGLMPNLSRLAISGDGCLYHAKHLILLLEHWNKLSSLSLDGVIMKTYSRIHDKMLKLIATKTKLTRLDFLLKLTHPNRSLDMQDIKWDLSRELSSIFPRLTHFSIRDHTKATLPRTLRQLGRKCSYLRLEQCDCVAQDLPKLKCANKLEHSYLKEDATSIPVELPQFKALRTLELRGTGIGLFYVRKLILGTDFFTHLNQNPNLSTVAIESTETCIPIATSELARYQVKQVKALTLLSQGWFQQSGELSTGDDICRLFATLFPSVETLLINSASHVKDNIVTENDLRHFAALQKFKLQPYPFSIKAKWQSV